MRWECFKTASVKWIIAAVSLLALSGCVRGCASRRPPIHLNPNMDAQPKLGPQGESRFFYNGSTQQPPVPGTIARGELRENEEAYTGRSFWGFYITSPYESSDELVTRGKDRFQIYCTPCHGTNGDGKGMLYHRSKIESADLREERIQQMPDGRLYEVITDGSGQMPAYRHPIAMRDRWAIVAYVRELQRSR